MAGSIRAYNMHPGVRAIIKLFQLEHNRLVRLFSINQVEWSPEKKYLEARRWVIAFYQSISTREYLAALLGAPLKPYTGYKRYSTVPPNHSITSPGFLKK
eukprot:TRINITY_DN17587_c0_g1_i1.p1 TRINITY_DN17587_c0_g1~~TRINITY_DN17587_c0_g1_i1.p1  ORF type:complete len:100 (+),score=16.72 TRINITY_DN17587_c0_g1_i1:108-407(+)